MRSCCFITTLCKQKWLPVYFTSRSYSALPKRFYRNVNVITQDESYEITLDQRVLKTPQGNVLKIYNESLAVAVAAEWDSQKERVQKTTMHLTALCNTAIDNPHHLCPNDIVNKLLNFLDSDTILYFSGENDELFKLQSQKWNPLVDWFKNRFSVQIETTTNIFCPATDEAVKNELRRHLQSYDFFSLHGMLYAVESLKSLILTLCCIEREISIETAVLLSRLEEEFQTNKWGRVEWAHDLNQVDLQSRVSAAVMFVHLNLESTRSLPKRSDDV